MRILMLVATSVVTDTRVLREAGSLVAVGHSVHVIGKDVPSDFVPPSGITVSSAGATSVFRPAGKASASGRRLSTLQRMARWTLLPQHRNQAFGSWARAALADARTRDFDVVHAHDFTALESGATVAVERGVPYIYDSHELWLGRQRQYRPTPLQDRGERQLEARLGQAAAAVITVGEGVANSLRASYGWSHVVVVRNSFPVRAEIGVPLADHPCGLVYAGRVDAFRELETVLAAAARTTDLPLTLVGPTDEVWLGRNQDQIAGAKAQILAPISVDDVTALLRTNGLALVTHSDKFESHVLALPNKLFHAVHAGVPVIATDVSELASVVRQFDLGETYAPGDPAALVAAIRRAVARYGELVASVAAAAGTLSWDADSRTLHKVYDGLGAK